MDLFASYLIITVFWHLTFTDPSLINSVLLKGLLQVRRINLFTSFEIEMTTPEINKSTSKYHSFEYILKISRL